MYRNIYFLFYRESSVSDGFSRQGSGARTAQKPASLDRLIILANFGVLAQHAVDRLEHVAEARFRRGAFDHNDEFGLI
jgi:hypothetical protein